MVNVKKNFWVPSDGYKYLTDGKTWCIELIIGKNDKISRWHDTNDEPKEEIDYEETTIDAYEIEEGLNSIL